ncbi:MAG: 1-deoxy-D-xylulose-5-phosphate synthase [Lentisphaeria bacterium]|nr:1-deoxy-D-xylulose-5-phosphate synthase [Lentisphaeria bacterium]
MYLDGINSPADLRKLPETALADLAAEIRERIVGVVGRNGGHLASNLGVVELTIALHRVFDSPDTPFFFDVGHQCYTHKLLTGRAGSFDTLRRFGGLSGFPSPAESPHDPAFAGHSGSALSLALGVAAAREAAGDDRKVVAILGDASLSNGVTLEALNSTSCGGRNLIVVLNDNRMSITRGVGALRKSLNRLIAGRRYNSIRGGMKRALREYDRGSRIVRGIKDLFRRVLFSPGMWFSELGIRYFGPVDGHSIPELTRMLRQLGELEGPLLLHVVTEKGHGCEFAAHEPTLYHGVKGYTLPGGEVPRGGASFSAAFGAALCRLAEAHPEISAVSAAMIPGTGLAEFQRRFPDRCHDVGIAEEHAVTFSAGLALAGRRPVCAIYSTFMQRALDCVYHDVVLGGLPVIFALDRAGVTADGPTHHGIYDLGFLRGLPGLTVMEPATARELAAMLEFAYALRSPVVLRYPAGAPTPEDAAPPEPLKLGRAQVVVSGDAGAPVLWSAGAEIRTALETARCWCERFGEACTVVNARFLKPFDAALARTFACRPQVAIEDAASCGGLYSALAEALAATPGAVVLSCNWPDRVLPHGQVADIRAVCSLSAAEIVERLAKKLVKS